MSRSDGPIAFGVTELRHSLLVVEVSVAGRSTSSAWPGPVVGPPRGLRAPTPAAVRVSPAWRTLVGRVFDRLVNVDA